MIDLTEYAQGLFPGLPGSALLARAVLDIAEMIERDGLVVPVGAFPAQVNSPLIAGDGLGVVAEVLMDVAEAVPGGDVVPAAFAERPDPGQGLLAVGEGLGVVAEQRMAVADVVEASAPAPVS